MADLYMPKDIDAASDAWGANCGPAALAAALGVDVGQVRGFVSDGDVFPGYMTVTKMVVALDRSKVRWWAHYKPKHGARTPDAAYVAEVPRPTSTSISDAPQLTFVWLDDAQLCQPAPVTRVATGKMVGDVQRRIGEYPVIVCLQFIGKWIGTPGAPTKRHFVTYRRTTDGPMIFDVNAGWLPSKTWIADVARDLMPKRGWGWAIQWAARIEPEDDNARLRRAFREQHRADDQT